MAEPVEFSTGMDPPEEKERSPYNRMKTKVKKKIVKQLDKVTMELNEELDENKHHVNNLRDTAHDLVEPETLQKWVQQFVSH